MSLSNFHPAEAIRLYLSSCASSSGSIVDPTNVTLTYWPANSSLVHRTTNSTTISTGSSGQLYSEIVATTSQVGHWDYRWQSTGPYKFAFWGAFRVIDPPRST